MQVEATALETEQGWKLVKLGKVFLANSDFNALALEARRVGIVGNDQLLLRVEACGRIQVGRLWDFVT